MLTISDVTYRVGGKRGRALLDHASAQLHEGIKVGLVGRNGIGKSTLLDLIRGRLMPDDGDIILPRGHRIGFLAQEAPSGDGTPLATVLAADRERSRLLAELDADPPPERIAEIEARLDTIGARRSTNCRAAGACASRWRPSCSPSRTCCCSTNQPTTSIWRRHCGWSGICAATATASSWSATTASCSMPRRPARCISTPAS
jgi:energy-coupling factor transporter ATP-binding protein EcfA2